MPPALVSSVQSHWEPKFNRLRCGCAVRNSASRQHSPDFLIRGQKRNLSINNLTNSFFNPSHRNEIMMQCRFFIIFFLKYNKVPWRHLLVKSEVEWDHSVNQLIDWGQAEFQQYLPFYFFLEERLKKAL